MELDNKSKFTVHIQYSFMKAWIQLLPFRTILLQDIFQGNLNEAYKDIDNVTGIADKIICRSSIT